MQIGSMTLGNMTMTAPPPPPPGSILFSNPPGGSVQYGAFADANDLDMGTGNFTIDYWLKFTSSSQYHGPFSKGLDSGSMFVVYDTGNLRAIQVNVNDNFYPTDTDSSTNVWYHYALVRNGNVFNFYKDGTSIGNGTFSVDLTNSAQFTIGKPIDGGSSIAGFTGYISCFRVVKGTAIYTSNFSKPTTPPTAVSGTSLLLLSKTSDTAWTDSSGTNKTAVQTAGTWSSDNPFS